MANEVYDPTGSFSENALAGAGKFFHDLYLRGRQVARDPTAQAAIDEAKRLDVPLMHTAGGMLGNVGAGMLITAPLGGGLSAASKAVPWLAKAASAAPNLTRLGTAATQGGLSAASAPVSTGETNTGNIATGAGFGALGQLGANAVGSLVRPAMDYASSTIAPLAKRAMELGIPLRAGQVTESKFGNLAQNMLSLLPLSGRSASKDAQRKAFTEAATGTFGQPSDNAVRAVGTAKMDLGKQFNTISGRNNMYLSQGDSEALDAIPAAHIASGGTEAEATQLSNMVKNIKNQYAKNDGVIPGTQYQDFRTQLGRQERSTANNEPMQHSWGQIKDTLDNAMFRALPAGEQDSWQTLQRQWANMKTVEKALPRSGEALIEGNLDPAKLTSVMTSPTAKNSYNATAMQGPVGSSTLSDVAKAGNAFVTPSDNKTFGHLTDWAKGLGTLGAVGAAGVGMEHLFPGETDEEKNFLQAHPWLTAAGMAGLGLTAGRYANSSALTRGSPFLNRVLTKAEDVGIPASTGTLGANAWAGRVPPVASSTQPNAADQADPFAGLEPVK